MNTIIIEKKSKYDSVMENELDGFKFVLKARDPKERRDILRNVLIDGGLAVCTDGSRLHMYMSDMDIEDGIYKVVSAKTSQIILEKMDNCGEYPDYKKLFPAVKWDMTITCNGLHHSLFQAVYQNYANDVVTFQTDFLHDAYMENCELSIMQEKDKVFSALIMYNNDNKAAMIMPIKQSQT